ncbi:sugar ABC transporter substrate-binding protein [Streptomyces sp. AJS327]|uniref:ABC transporter substrate-binding protein n=1 Tax=Streptomyces sp. AJS327 TaxID=2545265 RepID=UPI0015DE5342|nr:sugar ABC transporter substrate-binding protein [Streptomyces sp. AJS327]MBA0051010.1 sugar ABC transporter substrate-binding protein [Streptomyces sp. AJS327]
MTLRTPPRTPRRAARPTRTALAAVLGLGLLAACGGGDGRDRDGTITLDYLSLAWQKESVATNKALVKRWNDSHSKVKIRYVQGSWDNVHDQLLTSFEGGEAPDIIHDAADDLTDFAHGGYLADLSDLLPKRLRDGIPKESWSTTTYQGGVWGVPILHEPRVLIANTKLLRSSGVRVPTVREPWTWREFEGVARKLTADRNGDGRTDRYGVAWGMSEPVSQSVNLSRSTGGEIIGRERTDDGPKNRVRYGPRESAVAETINRQVNKDRSAPRSSLGMQGSDTLPGFFAGRYAMVPLNFSFRQQVLQQAPDGFEWSVLPMPAGEGPDGLAQGVSPQTLSVAEDSDHKQAAADFVAYLSRPDHLAELAKGDWILPTGTEALRDPALNTRKHGWKTGADLARKLRPAPVLGVRGYPEWSDKIATPAFQRYYRGDIDLAALRSALVGDGNRVLNRYQR